MGYNHHNHDEGYTVDQLIDHLADAAKAGYGQRKVMIGPVTPDVVLDIVETGTIDGEPMGGSGAIAIAGIEINDPPSGEADLCWLYPSDLQY